MFKRQLNDGRLLNKQRMIVLVINRLFNLPLACTVIILCEHPVLDGGGVCFQEIVEEAADELIQVLLYFRHRRLIFILELIVYQMNGSFLYLLFLFLFILAII